MLHCSIYKPRRDFPKSRGLLYSSIKRYGDLLQVFKMRLYKKQIPKILETQKIDSNVTKYPIF